jgi:hypothetical protein
MGYVKVKLAMAKSKTTCGYVKLKVVMRGIRPAVVYYNEQIWGYLNVQRRTTVDDVLTAVKRHMMLE